MEYIYTWIRIWNCHYFYYPATPPLTILLLPRCGPSTYGALFEPQLSFIWFLIYRMTVRAAACTRSVRAFYGPIPHTELKSTCPALCYTPHLCLPLWLQGGAPKKGNGRQWIPLAAHFRRKAPHSWWYKLCRTLVGLHLQSNWKYVELYILKLLAQQCM